MLSGKIHTFAAANFNQDSMFTENDLKQFKKRDIPLEKIEQQIENFRKGFPFVKLVAAAVPGNGIHVLNDDETAAFTAVFDKKAPGYAITKMVPASGAASRMFKDLLSYMNSQEEAMAPDVEKFINRIEDFAFYPALKKVLAHDDYSLDELLAEGKYRNVLRYLLTDAGLDYASLPKGLLFFHKHETGHRTPLEEHMIEGMEYSMDNNNIVHLHFTVSPEHKEKFLERTSSVLSEITRDQNINFDISWSEQKASTDTIAVDMNNEPFRNDDGSILFRPGGHGALIENLNDLETDIAFIKNIDNVVPDHLKQPTHQYKKVIGGILIESMERSFEILRSLDSEKFSPGDLKNAVAFAREDLDITFDDCFDELGFARKKAIIFNKLNRPIRVCGMVKNEGEPGGGPFWIEDETGNISLQIVESSQIDLKDEKQKSIVAQATHFNPVDLVCSLRDYKGNKFNLIDYIDHQTGFISRKSKDGRDLKAQELPGLWNGAMAHWITLFVEVPIETFNPVKTINDLLRPQHQ